MKLTVVSEAVVKQVVTREMAYDAFKQSFEAVASSQAKAFDVVFGEGFEPGQVFGAKSGNNAAAGQLGLKVGSYWPGNRELPAHGSTTILLDPDTGNNNVISGLENTGKIVVGAGVSTCAPIYVP